MLQTTLHKRAIALLITVFFIMAITLSVGVGLKYLKNASKNMDNELFILQTSIVLDDVLNLLKESKKLEKVNSATNLSLFLAETSLLPFESNNVKVIVEISSARDKININTIVDPYKIETFKNFLLSKEVNIEYANMILDSMNGIKEDMSYNTQIFDEKPYLFRDYVASHQHLEEINDSYLKNYHDNSVEKIDMQELFYISKDKNTSIDLNYATALTWEFMLSCDVNRAEMLEANGAIYTNIDELNLSAEELFSLNKFQTSFYEPHIDVTIDIIQKNMHASIRFEYNIVSKKGSNFVYEV